MARLDLYRDGRFVKGLELGERTYLIGREPSCDLVLGDNLVSRRHFQLRWQDDGYLLKDMDTPNGTLVNGVREFNRKLRVPATLQVGSEMMLFDPDKGDAPEEDDELPEWALDLADDESSTMPSTAHIAPAELNRMQARVRARQRPHLLQRQGPRGTAEVFPLDTKVSQIGFGPVRISLGPSLKGREEVLAEATRMDDGRVKIRAKGLFGKVEVNGKNRKEAVLGNGDAVSVAGVRLEFHAGLEGGR